MNKRSDCRFKKKLNSYLDNELCEADFTQIKDHLLTCQVCQNEIRELNKLNGFLNNFQEEDVPDYIKENIMNEVATISDASILRRSKISKLSIAASIAASFIIGLLFSSITFTESTDSLTELSLGQESLYSYYVTE